MADQAAPARVAGLPVGVVPGGVGNRFVAYLIDNVVPVLVTLLAGVLVVQTNASPAVVGGIAFVLVLGWILLVWWMFATRAAGPGMRLMHLQLVGLDNGRPIGWIRFLIRQLILSALASTGIGLLLMAIFLVRQPRRQGWHDLAVTSVVIKERQLIPPHPARAVSSSSVAPDRTAPPAPLLPTPPLQPPLQAPPQAEPLQPPTADPVPSPAVSAPPSPVPSAVAEPAAADPPAGAGMGWRAVLDDGREISIDALVLLGRNPQPRPGEEQAALIKIADTTRTVSKSHLEIGRRGSGLYVVDRGSTNGSTVTGTSGVSQRCAPGEPVSVESGSIVSFGDHWLEIRFS